MGVETGEGGLCSSNSWLSKQWLRGQWHLIISVHDINEMGWPGKPIQMFLALQTGHFSLAVVAGCLSHWLRVWVRPSNYPNYQGIKKVVEEEILPEADVQPGKA